MFGEAETGEKASEPVVEPMSASKETIKQLSKILQQAMAAQTLTKGFWYPMKSQKKLSYNDIVLYNR